MEVVLDHLELRELRADLLELLAEHRADPIGRLLAGAGIAEVLHEALDVGQGEAQGLQLDDPVDAVDRRRPIETKTTLRPRGRLEQPQLFVQVHRPDGLADHLGELAYTK